MPTLLYTEMTLNCFPFSIKRCFRTTIGKRGEQVKPPKSAHSLTISPRLWGPLLDLRTERIPGPSWGWCWVLNMGEILQTSLGSLNLSTEHFREEHRPLLAFIFLVCQVRQTIMIEETLMTICKWFMNAIIHRRLYFTMQPSLFKV